MGTDLIPMLWLNQLLIFPCQKTNSSEFCVTAKECCVAELLGTSRLLLPLPYPYMRQLLQGETPPQVPGIAAGNCQLLLLRVGTNSGTWAQGGREGGKEREGEIFLTSVGHSAGCLTHVKLFPPGIDD